MEVEKSLFVEQMHGLPEIYFPLLAGAQEGD